MLNGLVLQTFCHLSAWEKTQLNIVVGNACEVWFVSIWLCRTTSSHRGICNYSWYRFNGSMLIFTRAGPFQISLIHITVMVMQCPCLVFTAKWAPFRNSTSSSEPENGPVASDNVFYSGHSISNWFIYTKRSSAKLCWMFHVVSSVVCSLRAWQCYQLSYRRPCWQNQTVETGLKHSRGVTK